MLISFPISDKRESKSSSKLPAHISVYLEDRKGQQNIHEYIIIDNMKNMSLKISENLEAGQTLPA
jgi:hypothetical protein